MLLGAPKRNNLFGASTVNEATCRFLIGLSLTIAIALDSTTPVRFAYMLIVWRRDMNSLHLKYFSKVYESLNYSQSAEELFISRQALRQDIQSIEKEIGQPLFVNLANKLHPTPAADTLYKESRKAVRELTKLDVVMESLRAQAAITLRCGLISNSSDCFSEEELAFYQKASAGRYRGETNAIFATGSCLELKKQVASGDLDCAQIIITRPLGKQFDYRVGTSGRIYLYVHKDNPLAQKETVAINDLKDERLITQGEGYDLHELVVNQCQKNGFSPTFSMVAPNTPDALTQVASGNSIAYGTLANLKRYYFADVVSIPFEEPFMKWQLVIFTRKGEFYDGSLADRYFMPDKLEGYSSLIQSQPHAQDV